VVNVWMREDGFAFDKLVLTTNASYPAPTGAGPGESANVGGASGGAPAPVATSSSKSHRRLCGAAGFDGVVLLALAFFLRRRR